MKILFINPIVRVKDDPRHIPYGLAVLASIVRQDGYEVEILDINAHRYTHDTVKNKLNELKYDVIGIGGIISTYREVKWLVEYIKEIRPDVPVIVGGSVGSSIPELILKKTKADLVCMGEGDETILEYLNALKRGTPYENIKGLALRAGDKIYFTPSRPLIKDLDALPMPAYDLVPIDIYANNPVVGFGRELDFISSRGCPYNCVFCYQAFGRTFRAHSAGYVIRAIKHLKRTYGIDCIYFADDEFMGNRKRAYEFAEIKMADKDICDIKWNCSSRVNLVDLGLYKHMKKAGCIFIGYGFESGSDFILKKIKKGITRAQQKEAVRITRESGVRLGCSFMLGFPWETYETAQATVDLCVEAQIPLSALMFAVPYPKTELFDYCWEKGIINDRNLEDFILGMDDAVDLQLNITENFTDEALIALRDKMIEEVRQKVPAVPKEALIKQFIDLYGEENYGIFKKRYAEDPKIQDHYKKHGFNNFF